MANKDLKDLDDELDDQEIDLEDDIDDKEEEGKEESSEEKQPDSEEIEIEGSEEDGKKQISDAEREEIRARRRREKKMKRERERREKDMLQKTVLTMAQEINSLKKSQGEVAEKFNSLGAKKFEDEQKELQQIYSQANMVMKKAIAEADGEKFAEAKAISDRAFARFNLLESQKALSSPKTETKVERAEETTAEAPKFDQQTMKYANDFIRKNSSWYNPRGEGRESKIVQAIDTDLYEEGYDPSQREYWEELEARAAEVLPHRFKKNPSAQKAKVTVGGSGKDSNPASYKTVQVPKEFLQTLKAAGYEQGSEKYKAAVKSYYASQRKGA